jgi:hypothetical protein
MSKSDEVIANLLALADDDGRPLDERLRAVDERLAAFRAELDRWGASEPTDEALLRQHGEDLNERLKQRLAASDLSADERAVLQHALDVQRTATRPASAT